MGISSLLAHIFYMNYKTVLMTYICIQLLVSVTIVEGTLWPTVSPTSVTVYQTGMVG